MLSDVRAPRLKVMLDGAEIPGALGVEIHSNNHFSADRFRVRFAAQIVPADALHIPDGRIEIRIDVDGLEKSQIVGTIDAVHFDPAHAVVDIEGRDLSSFLIESQADETFANRTSSEIAALFAERHGFSAAVEPTRTPIGRYYQSEHDRVVLGQFSKAMTEWDLLAYLATREGFELYMALDTLCFGPASNDLPRVLRAEDCISLQLDHCVGLARKVEVTVRSWNSKSGHTVVSTARGQGTGKVVKRSITRPNLASNEAAKLAERVITDLRRHEWTANLTMPGELTLSPRSRVEIAGTVGPWDRLYFTVQLSRYLDARNGFTQRLTLQGAH